MFQNIKHVIVRCIIESELLKRYKNIKHFHILLKIECKMIICKT